MSSGISKIICDTASRAIYLNTRLRLRLKGWLIKILVLTNLNSYRPISSFPDYGNRNTKKLPASSIWFFCKWSTATSINLFSSVINDNFAGELSQVAMKSSSTKSYLSCIFLSWVFLSTEKAYSSFPRLKNLELILFINTLLLHGLNPRPSLYNISAKNHLNCLQNLLFESLFLWVFVAIFGCGNIFDQRLLFDNKQLCIWPLELSEH